MQFKKMTDPVSRFCERAVKLIIFFCYVIDVFLLLAALAAVMQSPDVRIQFTHFSRIMNPEVKGK